MFLNTFEIRDESLVTDIVTRDYRTSSVFRKYDIDFCCGGRVPLKVACEIQGLDKEKVKTELTDCLRTIHLSNQIDYNSWTVDFLIDYIRNIHHSYLIRSLPEIGDALERFTTGHEKKFDWLPRLLSAFRTLRKILLPHMEHEEQVMFPYIRQIAHAFETREPYAALLVRTLRKPVEEMMHQEHRQISNYLHLARQLTSNYALPEKACVTHKVCFSMLQELDNDLVQHTHLENNILFPKALAMEKELLLEE